MNRTELQELAEIRIEEASVLLTNGKWDGAFYLSGYAIECAFKARIAKQTREFDFPDKQLANRVHTHDIDQLITHANLRSQLDIQMTASLDFKLNWLIVKDWTESSRYQRISQSKAESLFDAVTSSPDGVLPWIKLYW